MLSFQLPTVIRPLDPHHFCLNDCVLQVEKISISKRLCFPLFWILSSLNSFYLHSLAIYLQPSLFSSFWPYIIRETKITETGLSANHIDITNIAIYINLTDQQLIYKLLFQAVRSRFQPASGERVLPWFPSKPLNFILCPFERSLLWGKVLYYLLHLCPL